MQQWLNCYMPVAASVAQCSNTKHLYLLHNTRVPSYKCALYCTKYLEFRSVCPNGVGRFITELLLGGGGGNLPSETLSSTTFKPYWCACIFPAETRSKFTSQRKHYT